MSLTISISNRLAPVYLKTTGISGGNPLSYSPSLSFATGTGAGQVDLLYAGTRTLGISASEDLDFAGGLTDVFGATLTFVKVRYMYVKPASANTNQVVMGGAASNQFVGPFGAATHTLSLAPGYPQEFFAPSTGWAVTAGTADLLKFLNGGAGTSVTYDLIIAGTSA